MPSMSPYGLLGSDGLPASAQARWGGVLDENARRLESVLETHNKAVKSIKTSDELTSKGVAGRMREEAQAAAESIDAETAKRRESIDRAIAKGTKELPSKVASNMDDAGLQTMAWNMLTFIGGFDELERSMKIENAVKEGDSEVIAALEALPTMVRRSVFDDESWESLRRTYFQGQAPTKYSSIEDARQALKLVVWNSNTARGVLGFTTDPADPSVDRQPAATG